MRRVLGVAFLMALVGAAAAEPGVLSKKKFLYADAASDACFAGCANDNASCKRVCPTTLGTPCLSACDSQAQTCRQGCQNR
jgi:hypothetical protein